MHQLLSDSGGNNHNIIFGRPCKSLALDRSRFLAEPVATRYTQCVCVCVYSYVYNTRITK